MVQYSFYVAELKLLTIISLRVLFRSTWTNTACSLTSCTCRVCRYIYENVEIISWSRYEEQSCICGLSNARC